MCSNDIISDRTKMKQQMYRRQMNDSDVAAVGHFIQTKLWHGFSLFVPA